MSWNSLPPLQLMMVRSHVNSFGVVQIYTVQKTLPVGTATVERSFSQMKMIITRLRNDLSGFNLTHLMRIAIEGPRLNLMKFLKNQIDV